MVSDKVEKTVKSEVKKTFNPEFLNRLDEIILFQSLTRWRPDPDCGAAGAELNGNLAQKSITISVTEEAKKWILDKTLVDRSYGARPLRRALQRYVEDPLSEALIAGKIHRPAGVPRGLSRREPAVLSPGERRRERDRGEAGGRAAVQRLRAEEQKEEAIDSPQPDRLGVFFLFPQRRVEICAKMLGIGGVVDGGSGGGADQDSEDGYYEAGCGCDCECGQHYAAGRRRGGWGDPSGGGAGACWRNAAGWVGALRAGRR